MSNVWLPKSKSKPKSQQAKVVHCSGKEQTKADSVWLQGRLMSPCNLTVLCTLRLPADTHAPRISQHSQMKTSRSRGSRSAVYLCLRVVRLRSSFCLLLWILLKDQGKIDIQWCVTWCRKQRRDNTCLWILRWGETKRPIHHFILIVTAILTSNIMCLSVLCSVHMSCSTCKCNSNVQFRLAAGAPTYPPLTFKPSRGKWSSTAPFANRQQFGDSCSSCRCPLFNRGISWATATSAESRVSGPQPLDQHLWVHWGYKDAIPRFFFYVFFSPSSCKALSLRRVMNNIRINKYSS